MKIALCLLTLNERECLELMLPRLPQPGKESGFDEIYAIDGGSTDGTVEVFKKHNIPVIAQSIKGRGHGYLEAFRCIDADGYIFFSPDGNEDPADLPRFRTELEKGAAIVIASRMMAGARNEEDDQIFRWRKWANNAFNLLANWLFNCGPFITDSINGYRSISRPAVDHLNLDAPDYSIEFQMTIRAMKAGLTIKEFPTNERCRLAGETGAPSFQTGLRFLKRLFFELVIGNKPLRSTSKTPSQ